MQIITKNDVKSINKRRKSLGISITEIAKYMKCSRSHLSRVLKGERPMYGNVVDAIDWIEFRGTQERKKIAQKLNNIVA